LALLKEKNILLVIIFAIAMAYLESAVVVYLRGMYGIKDLLRDINFQVDAYTFIEIGREAATIVMLSLVSSLAGSNWLKKVGFFFLSFGIWDIFYYIWLYVFIQWPKSLFEWDVLFLIPLPWWGPVIAPILISILLVVIGYLLIVETKFKIKKFDWFILFLSVIVILFTFMEDSINIILTGEGNLAEVRPTKFDWVLYSIFLLVWVLTIFKIFLPTVKNIKES
jgi:hypothetical protein